MRTILVVVDGEESNEYVLEAAVERAEREGASLVVLNILPRAAYEARQDAIARSNDVVREGYAYTSSQARAAAARKAELAARATIGDREVPYVAVGAIGPPARAALRVAAEHGCDETVVAATKPRYFGLFERIGLFRGVDRTISERFDGTVTVVPAPVPEDVDPAAPIVSPTSRTR